MKEQDYEQLSQYLDGELASPEAQALRRRVLAEPELRAALDKMRKINDEVQSAFDLPGADRVPPSIAARLSAAESRQTGTVTTPAGSAVATLVAAPAPWKMALAATLVAAAGVLMVPDWQETSRQDSSVGVPTSDLLSSTLEGTPSRADGWDTMQDGRQVRAVLSFASRSGSWCREYLIKDAANASRGVACRDNDGQWKTVAYAVTELNVTTNDYRPAGAGDSDQIASYIDIHAQDIPLSRQQERDLIAKHWQ